MSIGRFTQKALIKIDKNIIDLGSIRFPSNSKFVYKISNIGNADLLIDTISSSCGCTQPSLSKKKALPNQIVELTVGFTPVDTGFFDKKIVIKSNIDSVFTVVRFIGKALKQ